MVLLPKAMLSWKTTIPSGSGVIPCQFNPSELTITKTADWGAPDAAKTAEGGTPPPPTSGPNFNAPKVVFKGGGSATYKLSLFFDTTNLGGLDVRTFTDPLISLSLRGAGKASSDLPNSAPPVVTFIWGRIILFKAVVKSVSVQYTMFAMDGTPIRAKASVDFLQFDQTEDITPHQNPTSRSDSRKTYIAHAGQRLDQIAYQEYNDSRYWRLLAESNHIDDPFALSDGQILVIPTLD